VLEATYGWYWAADVLTEAGAQVHLAHPLGIKGFNYRRVKNDVRDAADLADLLRMGRLPEAWIAPPEVRELRELVRHRAKLVMARSGFKAGVHAVLAKQGLHLQVKDLFGPAGRVELAAAPLDRAYRARVNAYLRLVEAFDVEIELAGGWIAAPASHRPRIPGNPADPGRRADLGRGVRRRDRRRHPLRLGPASVLLGRTHSPTPRVRHHRAPRPDHQDGMWRPRRRLPFRGGPKRGSSSCR
jgi:hypothetical protein